MSRTGAVICILAVITATAAAETPKPPVPVAPRQHPPQGVPSCAFEKTYGTIEGSVSVGAETWIHLKLTAVKLESTKIETSVATEAYADVRLRWAAGKEYAASGDFRVRRLLRPVGGRPAVRTFKHVVTAGKTNVRNTASNNLNGKAAELSLKFNAPRTGMVAFLREAEGTIRSIATDSARPSRTLTLTANVEGIGPALDELVMEADKRTADWAAGRCK